MDSHAQEHTQKLILQVTYNGVTKAVPAEPHEVVKAALERAIREFGATDRTHVLSLWFQGNELPDTASIESLKLPNDAAIQLRPSTVKGGMADAS